MADALFFLSISNEVLVGTPESENSLAGKDLLSDPSTWVETHGDVLFRYALGRLGDPGAAENIVQETLLAALESRASFSGRSSARTWLIGILKHKIIDHFRKNSREISYDDVEVAKEPEGVFSQRGKWINEPRRWDRTPDDALEDAQLWEAMEQCLAGLSPRLGQIFTLREMEGIKGPELCKVLNISATNLGVMIYRARSQLRSCLEKTYFCSQENA